MSDDSFGDVMSVVGFNIVGTTALRLVPVGNQLVDTGRRQLFNAKFMAETG